jgi:hypothetical protein
MGPWRGLLPKRRITPPPILGSFIDMVTSSSSSLRRDAQHSPVANPAEVFAEDDDAMIAVGARELFSGGGLVHASGLRSDATYETQTTSWAHL